jgi:hypothetical protein
MVLAVELVLLATAHAVLAAAASRKVENRILAFASQDAG